MDNKATMKDVARVAGVSLMTVSRVLNGTAKVNPETEKLVRRAVQKLHFKPNELARALRGMKSRSIGIIVPYLYDQFFATCAHEATVVAREHGYSVILATSGEDGEVEYVEAQLMLQRDVEGMLIIPANHGSSKLSLPEFNHTPIVLMDRPIQDPRFSSILVQNQSGARRAVQHLVMQHRHKRIAFIGMAKKLYTTHSRFEGYRREIMEHGLAPQAFFDCTTQESTSTVIRSAMSSRMPPTAFFTMNNLTTRYCLRALMEIGVSIPEEVAMVGFDDFELADILHPALTVIRQPAHELGNVAAKFLFNRIKSAEPHPDGVRELLSVELVIRRSCGCKYRSTHDARSNST
jgi:LacI family transcriptional regulator